MIDVDDFYNILINNGIEYFVGVPDSLLKDICAYITFKSPNNNHIITANEGGAIALGTGYHLATNKIPFIYMQNSGIGNAINPLLSLADKEVYSIPMILMIGWRGEPNTKDEPQHLKQGRVTTAILESLEIPYVIIDGNCDYMKNIQDIVNLAKRTSAPVAILIRKDTFNSFRLDNSTEKQNLLSREEALEEVIKSIPNNAIVVSTTGMLSRELFELREKMNQTHINDFLTVGSMGHTIQIALGIAHSKPEITVYCFDGDGSLIMHMGNYAITGHISPKNLKVIIFNNGAHDSVGGQPTVGYDIKFENLCHAYGIDFIGTATNKLEISEYLPKIINCISCSLLEIKIKKGSRSNLGRPTSSPVENKKLLMQFISQ
ncbi:MAG: phosphonopyruvate decarboxylase [Ignavibacteriae bacterium]|nr:phosphonopyruvate decarboxylase [Ignavibacteriota bacterium]